jgi:sugar phosphate isomerase/epimerase
MRSAAQLYTLREYCKTEKDYYDTMVKVKEMGYSSAQYSGMGPVDQKRVKEISDELGVPISATHIPHNDFINDLDNVIEKHLMWGTKYVGLGSMPRDFLVNEDSLKNFIEIYSGVADKLAKKGLRFIYHNHNIEFYKMNGKTVLDILFENVSANFFFELDTYWVQAGGADPVEWIKKLKGRCEYIHFKDMGVDANLKTVFKPIGQGNLNWSRIIEACRYSGVLYCAVEQDICEGSPFDALKASYDHLVSIGVK